MAVGATNNTLGDFRFEGLPTAATDHRADRRHLGTGIKVVKVERHDVGLTAINAGMGQKVRADSGNLAGLLLAHLLHCPLNVLILVELVVAPSISCVAGAAVVRQRPAGEVAV
jgi:hypothetical protein